MGRPKWVSYILVYVINKKHGLFWNKSQAFLIIGLAPLPPGPASRALSARIRVVASIHLFNSRVRFLFFFSPLPADKRPLS